MLRSIEQVNDCQRQRLLQAVRDYFKGNISGKQIAIWGLSFKPGTDDVRAAPSLSLIRSLVQDGAIIKAYDPVSHRSARSALGDVKIAFGQCAMEVCEQADALVVMTEWDEFKSPDLNMLATRMRGKIVFDARNIYKTALLQRHGLVHYRLGQTAGSAAEQRAGRQHDEHKRAAAPATAHPAGEQDEAVRASDYGTPVLSN